MGPLIPVPPGLPERSVDFRRLLTPDGEGLAPLPYLRERVLRATLVTAATAGIVAYLPSVILAGRDGAIGIVAVDTLCYLAVIIFALRPDLPYHVRAGSLVVIPFALALILLGTGGMLAPGAVWLTAFPITAALFFGLRLALVCLPAQLLVTIAMFWGAAQGWIRWDVAQGLGPEGHFWLWGLTAPNVMLVSGVVSLSVGVVIRGMEREALEREKLQGHLVQSEKLEAMGTLAGGIAHDFNNLLVPILVQTREVAEELPEGSAARRSLEEVIASAVRGRNLIRQILAFSREVEVERRPVEVDRALEEVASLLRKTIPPAIQLEVRAGAGGARVLADPSELDQILLNLGTNSFLAMRDAGGTLELRSEARTDEVGREEVILEVEDTGVGMDEVTLARVFDPYFTTRAPGEGTGLGLATVYRVTLSLGGSVELESEPGKGTVARIRLPRSRAPVADSAQAPGPPAIEGAVGSDMGLHHLLLVDDEAAVLRSAGMLLRRGGYAVTEFLAPAEALAYLREPSVPVDLVITDLLMPGMSGVELAEGVQEIQPGLPVLLTSGNLEPGMVGRMTEAGVVDTLAKPWDREGLLSAVSRALAKPS